MTAAGKNAEVGATDVVILGTGAAGLTAALVAAASGLRVTLLENSAQVGGTSARAAGTLWIPGNPFMSADDAAADIEQARHYLDVLVGDDSPSLMRDAFFSHGPAMLNWLTTNTSVRFKPCPFHADYHPELPGSRSGMRPVEPLIFDGRKLGETFTLLRPPIDEFMVFGGMMVSKADIDLLLKAGRSVGASWHALKLVTRYLVDRTRYPRGTRLTMGNALCASLLNECRQHGVELRPGTTVTSVEPTAAGTYQLQLQQDNRSQSIVARRGIVFAGGGFSGNASLRAQHLPRPTPLNTTAFDGANGSSQELARSLGAQIGPSSEDNAWWFPSSIYPRRHGESGVFPHIIMDRAKPGLIAVNRDGRRFTNEGASYHQFARAQYAANAVPCWLVCDHRFIRRYGLGAVRPRGFGLQHAIASGYIQSAPGIDALANAIGVDAANLRESAQRMTRFSQTGTDEDFGKGGDPLSRQNGDPAHPGPNPCLGPVNTPPFYAVQVRPTDLGTSRGLLTNTNGQLLDADGNEICGLYACGNDMQSIMGGHYPAPGVTLGPAMAFAFAAARDIVAWSMRD